MSRTRSVKRTGPVTQVARVVSDTQYVTSRKKRVTERLRLKRNFQVWFKLEEFLRGLWYNRTSPKIRDYRE